MRRRPPPSARRRGPSATRGGGGSRRDGRRHRGRRPRSGDHAAPGAPWPLLRTMTLALQLPSAGRRAHLEPQLAPAGRRLDLEVVGLADGDRLHGRPRRAAVVGHRRAVLGDRRPLASGRGASASDTSKMSSGVMLMSRSRCRVPAAHTKRGARAPFSTTGVGSSGMRQPARRSCRCGRAPARDRWPDRTSRPAR